MALPLPVAEANEVHVSKVNVFLTPVDQSATARSSSPMCQTAYLPKSFDEWYMGEPSSFPMMWEDALGPGMCELSSTRNAWANDALPLPEIAAVEKRVHEMRTSGVNAGASANSNQGHSWRQTASACMTPPIAKESECDSNSDSAPSMLASEGILVEEPPSRGSKNHAAGKCRPCSLQFSPTGCPRGQMCNFCHYAHGVSKFLEAAAFSTKASVRRALKDNKGPSSGGKAAGARKQMPFKTPPPPHQGSSGAAGEPLAAQEMAMLAGAPYPPGLTPNAGPAGFRPGGLVDNNARLRLGAQSGDAWAHAVYHF